MILSEINIYPIKSLQGMSLTTTEVTSKGLQFDRRWMIIDQDNRALTQRTLPSLCLFNTRLENNKIIVNKDDSELGIPVSIASGEWIRVKIWNDECPVLLARNWVNDWFSERLNKQVRLVYMPDTTNRQIDLEYGQNGDWVSLADGYPILLANEASLNELNRRLERSVIMKRFRPNLVFSGDQPFQEDHFQSLKIGNLGFRAVKPCSRCIMVNINSQTGLKDKEPLKTLSQFRLVDGKVMFGVNLIVEKQGKLSIGDSVVKI